MKTKDKVKVTIATTKMPIELAQVIDGSLRHLPKDEDGNYLLSHLQGFLNKCELVGLEVYKISKFDRYVITINRHRRVTPDFIDSVSTSLFEYILRGYPEAELEILGLTLLDKMFGYKSKSITKEMWEIMSEHYSGYEYACLEFPRNNDLTVGEIKEWYDGSDKYKTTMLPQDYTMFYVVRK